MQEYISKADLLRYFGIKRNDGKQTNWNETFTLTEIAGAIDDLYTVTKADICREFLEKLSSAELKLGYDIISEMEKNNE